MVRGAALASIVRPVDADPLALDQTALGDKVMESQAEDLLVHLVKQTAARLRRPEIVSRPCTGSASRRNIRGGIRSPSSAGAIPALSLSSPLEIADHVHAEVAAQRQ